MPPDPGKARSRDKRVRPVLRGAGLEIEIETADAVAIKAVDRGEATPEQQKRFVRWLLFQAAALDASAFDPTSERLTAFTLGRQFVGKQIAFALSTPTQSFRQAAEINAGKPTTPREQPD